MKVVLVGDNAVGKTCLITNYLHNTFTENYEPTVLDVYNGTKSLNKRQLDLELHDTSGDDNLAQNRKVVYSKADLFMLCVATNDKRSFENIGKWVDEISTVDLKMEVPIYLVLTKSDMASKDVTIKMLKEKSDSDERFIGSGKTSSKEWEDFNVHKTF